MLNSRKQSGSEALTFKVIWVGDAVLFLKKKQANSSFWSVLETMRFVDPTKILVHLLKKVSELPNVDKLNGCSWVSKLVLKWFGRKNLKFSSLNYASKNSEVYQCLFILKCQGPIPFFYAVI